jgi:hypothetical protein
MRVEGAWAGIATEGGERPLWGREASSEAGRNSQIFMTRTKRAARLMA